MKISYIITTIRPFYCAANMIESILKLKEHDFEIIVTSPSDFTKECEQLHGTKFVLDQKNIGSVYSNNHAIQHTNGDWLFFLPDDFKFVNKSIKTTSPSSHINEGYCKFDILEFLDYTQSERMAKKMFQMFTLAARTGNQIDGENYYTAIPEKYCVMHFPCVSRKTIENKLDGVIFNHRFRHGFVDHWLGYYASQFEEYEPYNYSTFKDPYDNFIELSFKSNLRNHANDKHDYDALDYVYKQFKNNPNIPYNI